MSSGGPGEPAAYKVAIPERARVERRWSEFERGGHFAALEQPELLADDLITFLAEL